MERERDAEFPQSVVYSFICISEEPPVKELSHETEDNYVVTVCRETKGQCAVGVQPGSLKGLFVTLVFLPQCHVAFSAIPSTLAWVDC